MAGGNKGDAKEEPEDREQSEAAEATSDSAEKAEKEDGKPQVLRRILLIHCNMSCVQIKIAAPGY